MELFDGRGAKSDEGVSDEAYEGLEGKNGSVDITDDERM